MGLILIGGALGVLAGFGFVATALGFLFSVGAMFVFLAIITILLFTIINDFFPDFLPSLIDTFRDSNTLALILLSVCVSACLAGGIRHLLLHFSG